MTQSEINTLKNLLLEMVDEIDNMDEFEVLDTFSEFGGKEDIKNTVYNIMDYVVDYMPVISEE